MKKTLDLLFSVMMLVTLRGACGVNESHADTANTESVTQRTLSQDTP